MKSSEIIEKRLRDLGLIPTHATVGVYSRRFSKVRQGISHAPATIIRVGFGAHANILASPDTFATLAKSRYWVVSRDDEGFIDEIWADTAYRPSTRYTYEWYDNETNTRVHPDPQPQDQSHPGDECPASS